MVVVVEQEVLAFGKDLMNVDDCLRLGKLFVVVVSLVACIFD